MAGRPTKLSASIQATICTALELGLTYELASAVAGITRQTLFLWVRRGEAGDRRYEAFWRAFRQANARSEVALLRRLWRAAEAGDWRAAAWILERRWPEEFGRPDAANLELRCLRGLTDEELLARISQWAGTSIEDLDPPPWMRGRRSDRGAGMVTRSEP